MNNLGEPQDENFDDLDELKLLKLKKLQKAAKIMLFRKKMKQLVLLHGGLAVAAMELEDTDED